MRVALAKSYVPSRDEGWTRWLLEQYEFPYTSIFDKDIREGKRNARFDAIVIPDQSVAALVDGQPAEAEGIGRERRPGGARDALQRALLFPRLTPGRHQGE